MKDHPKPLYEQAHDWLLPALQPGATAIDATCGNGYDTLFLCRTLGSGSNVVGIDIQEDAIRRTGELLKENGFRAILRQADHAEMDQSFEKMQIKSIDAAILNLGYLPHGDHTITTQCASTLHALRSIVGMASNSFRLSIVAYRGHPGGATEEDAVRSYFQLLTSGPYQLKITESRNIETGPVFLGIAYQ
jgi:SAM-dependent methyltransferase